MSVPAVVVGVPVASSIVEAGKDAEFGLPNVVAGTMDGTKPPLSRTEEMRSVVEQYRHKYGYVLERMQPWREFFQCSKPAGDLKERLQANLYHFQINYAAILVGFTALSVLIRPWCLLLIAALGGAWAVFLKKNEDPAWETNVGGMQLNMTHRLIVMGAFSAILVLSFLGQVFLSAAGMWLIFSVAHATLHPMPEGATAAAEDEGDTVDML